MAPPPALLCAVSVILTGSCRPGRQQHEMIRRPRCLASPSPVQAPCQLRNRIPEGLGRQPCKASQRPARSESSRPFRASLECAGRPAGRADPAADGPSRVRDAERAGRRELPPETPRPSPKPRAAETRRPRNGRGLPAAASLPPAAPGPFSPPEEPSHYSWGAGRRP